MSYAVMPLDDYVSTCDKVREKVDLTTVRFEDTDFGYIRSAIFTAKESGEYIFTVEVKDESEININDIYYANPEWEADFSPGMFNVIDGKTLSVSFIKGETVRIFISDYDGLKASDIVFATLSYNGEVVENFIESKKIKSGELADKVDEVYHKGQLDVISNVESLKGKARGTSPLTILDISPVEHNVGVKITMKPAFDGLLEGCTFEDTDFGYIRSTPFTVPETGYYTIALNLKDDSKWWDWVVAWSGWRADDSPPCSGARNPSENEYLHLWSGDTYSLFLGSYKGLTALDILSGTIEMGDNVVAPPTGGGDVDLATVKVTASGNGVSAEYNTNADGIVEGVKSIYPRMVITTDAEGVIISADYIKDIDKALNELTTAVALSGGE